MEKIYIKPAVAGTIVRHPEKLSYKIPDSGEWVTHTPQWQRYLNSGDIVICEPPAEVKPKSKEGIK